MSGTDRIAIDSHLDEDGAPPTMADEVRAGLSRSPKTLPSKYFYDDRGSELFERITDLPEYYLTRAEQTLLDDLSAEIARLAGAEDLVELGAGSAKKTRRLIEAGLEAGTLQRYVPMEVSSDMAESTARALVERYPGLQVHAVIGDFESHLDELPEGGPRLVAFLGSTIGNFTQTQAVRFLRKIGSRMAQDDLLLLGTDLVKERALLEAAYNDSAGITAEFNRNILNVLNNQLDGNFDPEAFQHVSYYNADEQRIESYLRAKRPLAARLEALDLDVEFERGEMVRTEVSCKYTRSSVEQLLGEAGLELVHWFTDPERTFALSLSRRA